MNAVDTSVAVAALLEWHVQHRPCVEAARDAAIPAHALVETYSVLTRLPAAHRPARNVVVEALEARFGSDAVLVPSVATQVGIIERLAAADIEGGACFDALVALTCADHDRRLLTCDTRAQRTYDALGIDYELLVTPSSSTDDDR